MRQQRRIQGRTLRSLRAEDRPRCRNKRYREDEDKRVSCGYLLDATGECWFCRHVDRETRRAFRESKP